MVINVMTTFSAVACPKCGEWREKLITPIDDPMGKRFYCCVCAHEFRESFCTPPAPESNSKKRGDQLY